MLKSFKHQSKVKTSTNKGKGRQASRQEVRQPFNLEWRKPGVLAALALVIITLLIMVTPKQEILPIEKIRVAGDFTHLDSARIEDQLKPYLGKGFFSVDIVEIQQLLKQQAWVKNVSVRRLWPNQIKVSIEEKQAVARWDDDHLLSREAIVFKADNSAFKHLPVIHGYLGQSVELLSRYKSLQHKFYEYGLQVKAMSEDSKGALDLKLDNGLEINLGSVGNDLKIDSFLAVYQHQIKPRLGHIRQIDFRYNNGFAIAWNEDYINTMTKSGKRGEKNV